MIDFHYQVLLHIVCDFLVNLRARFSLSLGNKICVSFARRMIRPPLPPCDLTHNGGRRYQILICHHPASIWRCYYNIIIIFVKIWRESGITLSPCANHKSKDNIFERAATYGWLVVIFPHSRRRRAYSNLLDISRTTHTTHTTHTHIVFAYTNYIIVYAKWRKTNKFHS